MILSREEIKEKLAEFDGQIVHHRFTGEDSDLISGKLRQYKKDSYSVTEDANNQFVFGLREVTNVLVLDGELYIFIW